MTAAPAARAHPDPVARTTEFTTEAPAPPAPAGSGSAAADGLWVQRTDTRRYTGRNTRGAVVAIGPVDADGVFSPGELMKLALAGCSGMTADSALSRRLGPDVAVHIAVAGPTDRNEVRYPALHEELIVDLSGLTADDTERVVTIVRRAIERYCTVGRTLEQSAHVELAITSRRPVTAEPATAAQPAAD